MAGQDIVQQLINRLGQSQDSRLPVGLADDFVSIDERSTADYYELLRSLSELINFYQNDSQTPVDNWSNFFPFSSGEAATWLNVNTQMPPHLALIQAFLDLYRYPQESLNRIPHRHLDFYYQQVLRLQPRSARPDKAHLLLELKKNADAIALKAGHSFSAGKDSVGKERIYQSTQTTVINQSKVSHLQSLFIEKPVNGRVRYAPIANSSDGLGAELPTDAKWFGFGHSESPVATTGFAISSPVLKMQEGIRSVSITINLSNVSPANIAQKNLSHLFSAYISGESAWLGPFDISPALSGHQLICEFEIGAEQEAVVDYNQEVHAYHFAASAPVVQLLLNTDKSNIGYQQLSKVLVSSIAISVDVKGVSALTLESDNGSLNASKAFIPFGTEPKKGSRLLVGYEEALNKKLSNISLEVEWKSPPKQFFSHYQHYGINGLSNTYFTVNASYQDISAQVVSQTGLALFHSHDASQLKVLSLSSSSNKTLNITQPLIAFNLSRYSQTSDWARQRLSKILLQNPVYTISPKRKVKPISGFITLELNQDFLHETYRKQYVKNILQYHPWQEDDPVIINEPYTPEIKSIRLNYKAYSELVNIESNTLSDFSNEDVHFYHLAYSGQRRDHTYQRHLFDYVTNKTVSLLTRDFSAGELLIGLEKLNPGDSLSLLFQVAEGSADPMLPREVVSWSVLCDNYWRPIKPNELILDSTNHLLSSGLVRLIIPNEATTENTLLASGYIWLKASVSGNPMAVSQLISVNANAIEVQFLDQNNDSEHLRSPLPAASITKSKQNINALKGIQQPYASFGGVAVEQRSAFNTRVAERLRHKGRALNPWDIERLVLENFKHIYKVKCIPHAQPQDWLSPGHVLVITVPDLTNQNAVNLLEPRVDSDTLASLENFLERIGNPQTKYHASNPSYQKVELRFKVRFNSGFEFNFYRSELNDAIVKFLSPWAYGESGGIRFGGQIYRSVLLDFIEELPYVDFVTDFSLYSYQNSNEAISDVNEVFAESPDAILVSVEEHIIEEVSSL